MTKKKEANTQTNTGPAAKLGQCGILLPISFLPTYSPHPTSHHAMDMLTGLFQGFPLHLGYWGGGEACLKNALVPNPNYTFQASRVKSHGS